MHCFAAHLTEILATLELIEHQSASLRSAVGSHNSSSVQSGPSTNSPNRTNIAPGGSIAESIGTEYNERFTNGLDRISESYQVLTKMLLLLRYFQQHFYSAVHVCCMCFFLIYLYLIIP